MTENQCLEFREELPCIPAYIDKTYLFAVTTEKPGGVVVSKQERIVLLAKVGA